MPKRTKPCRVRLTEHAANRYQERAGGKLSPHQVRRHLLGALLVGLPVDEGKVKVPLGEGLQAVCVPEFTGGWAVVTVIREEEAG